MNFRESCQLVANALQAETYGYHPIELSNEELFKARVKLNRSLKQVFKEIQVFHYPDTKKASVTANGFNY